MNNGIVQPRFDGDCNCNVRRELFSLILFDILDLDEGCLWTITTVEHRQETGHGQECSGSKQNAAEGRE